MGRRRKGESPRGSFLSFLLSPLPKSDESTQHQSGEEERRGGRENPITAEAKMGGRERLLSNGTFGEEEEEDSGERRFGVFCKMEGVIFIV